MSTLASSANGPAMSGPKAATAKLAAIARSVRPVALSSCTPCAGPRIRCHSALSVNTTTSKSSRWRKAERPSGVTIHCSAANDVTTAVSAINSVPLAEPRARDIHAVSAVSSTPTQTTVPAPPSEPSTSAVLARVARARR